MKNQRILYHISDIFVFYHEQISDKGLCFFGGRRPFLVAIKPLVPSRATPCNKDLHTFAYQLTSCEATELGIGGKYMLLHKVSEVEFDDGSLYPIVAVSLWDSEELPSSTKQYETASLLKLCRGGRNFTPPTCYEYRTESLIKNRKQLGLAPLIFVGNFSQRAMPSDEIIFTRGGDILMMLLETIETDLCRYWKINKRILSSIM